MIEAHQSGDKGKNDDTSSKICNPKMKTSSGRTAGSGPGQSPESAGPSFIPRLFWSCSCLSLHWGRPNTIKMESIPSQNTVL